MLRLDKRLTAVVNEVNGEVLADIGCDHGKVSAASLIGGKVKRVIACDISEDSLSKASLFSSTSTSAPASTSESRKSMSRRARR